MILLLIRNLYPGSFASNCYLLISGKHAVVVDPSADAQTVLDGIRESGASLDAILLTHGHFDHMLFADRLRELTGIPLSVHVLDAELLPDSRKNAFFTFFGSERRFAPAEKVFHDGDVIPVGDESLRVIHTPGHTRGSVCFLTSDGVLLTGDTLFAGGYGRTDLYGGSDADLAASLKKLAAYPADTPIYPGHGPASRIGDEL